MYVVTVKNGESVRINGVVYVGGQRAFMTEAEYRLNQESVVFKEVIEDKPAYRAAPMTKSLFNAAMSRVAEDGNGPR